GGREVRDDVHVRDVSRGVALALEACADGVFNISSGRGHTLADVARSVCRAAGGDLEPRIEESESDWIDRWFSIGAAPDAFSYAPQESFDEATGEMWESGT